MSVSDEIVRELRRNNALLREILAELRGDDEAPVVSCPHCGNADQGQIEDTSAMGDPRLTCHACKKSFRKESANG